MNRYDCYSLNAISCFNQHLELEYNFLAVMGRLKAINFNDSK